VLVLKSKKEKNLFTISFCENYESLLFHQPYFTILVGFILYEGFEMSYWRNCTKCGSRIYMAEVQPPNAYKSYWLPFEDELLNNCHIGHCHRTSKRVSLKATQKANFVKCPICNLNIRKNRLVKHKFKTHNKKLTKY